MSGTLSAVRQLTGDWQEEWNVPDINQTCQNFVIHSSDLVARKLKNLKLAHLDQHLRQLGKAVVFNT